MKKILHNLRTLIFSFVYTFHSARTVERGSVQGSEKEKKKMYKQKNEHKIEKLDRIVFSTRLELSTYHKFIKRGFSYSTEISIKILHLDKLLLFLESSIMRWWINRIDT